MYLDNAATTMKKPFSVYMRLISKTVFGSGNAGRGAHRQSMRAVRDIVDTQDVIARLFNISKPQNIVFTQNATYALNTAIFGTVRNGSHIVVTEMEHNSVLRPAYKLGNFTVVQADNRGVVSADDVRKAVRTDTALIVCTHASNVCGSIQPVYEIGEIAEEYGIPFLVDAAQTGGCLPLDAEKMKADMIAFSGHKGLMGPLGTGGLYIREPEKVMPFALGGTGSNSESIVQPEFMPDKFHSGTMNTPAIAALGSGVRFVLKCGVKAISDYERYLAKRLKENLLNMNGVTVYGSDNTVGTVAFNVAALPSEETFERLHGAAAVRAGYHCAPLAHKALGTSGTGAVRASFGVFNSKKDVERFSDCIYSIIKGLKG
jgi:cysteine desulfurase family protein